MQMEPLDRLYTNYEVFDVEYYRNLEMSVRDHSTSLKMVPLESLGTVSYAFHNYGRIFRHSEIFSVEK